MGLPLTKRNFNLIWVNYTNRLTILENNLYPRLLDNITKSNIPDLFHSLGLTRYLFLSFRKSMISKFLEFVHYGWRIQQIIQSIKLLRWNINASSALVCIDLMSFNYTVCITRMKYHWYRLARYIITCINLMIFFYREEYFHTMAKCWWSHESFSR
jgi:hypothetical protein